MSDVHYLLLKLKASISKTDYQAAIVAGRRLGAYHVGRVKIRLDGRRHAFDRFARVWEIDYAPGSETPWTAWRADEHFDSRMRPTQPIIVTSSKRMLRNELQRVAWDLTARCQLRRYTKPV